VFVKDLTFTNVSGNYLFMIGFKRDIIYDLDGSFSSAFGGATRTSGTIVQNFPHIAQYNQDKCTPASDPAAWDNAIMCNQDLTIRKIVFSNLMEHKLFVNQNISVVQINSPSEVVATHLSNALHTKVSNTIDKNEPKKDGKHLWSLPYVVGRTYQVWWGLGADFKHLSIGSTRFYTSDLPGVIFKFNYTENREVFDIGPFRGGKKLVPADYI